MSKTLAPPAVELQFRRATSKDLSTLSKLEYSSYPTDEAASLESLAYRIENASPYFLVATTEFEIVGFICSTRCFSFTHTSMSTHEPLGSTLAIHSVVVRENYRLRNIGTQMLKTYIDWIPQQSLKKIVLLAKNRLLAFYVNSGFEAKRVSDIAHGNDTWYHLEMELRRKCFVVDSFVNHHIDAFTASGNPAGVVLMKGIFEGKETLWLKNVAKEFNHSETAFVWERSKNEYDIRYYTKSGQEVDLCGHATLAAAAALLLEGVTGDVKFFAKNNHLVASKDTDNIGTDNNVVKITMDFPWKDVRDLIDETERQSILLLIEKVFQVTYDNVRFLGVGIDGEDLFVELTPAAFHSISQNPETLSLSSLEDCPGHSRGVILSCMNVDSDKVDFCSRFFGPKVGIDEDPVTGSAHCLLAPYYGKMMNKKKLLGRQMSQRGGFVDCILKKHENVVQISGMALRVFIGRLDV